ncbi:hypothetical protein ACG7TL_007154 [Trametes sanguinea]
MNTIFSVLAQHDQSSILLLDFVERVKDSMALDLIPPRPRVVAQVHKALRHEERENPAESLLKVEAGGRANTDKGRGGEELRPMHYGNSTETCRDGARRARTLSRPALYAPEVNAALGERAKAWHGSPRSRVAGNRCLRSWGPSQTFAGLRRRRARSRAHLGGFARVYGFAYAVQSLRTSQRVSQGSRTRARRMRKLLVAVCGAHHLPLAEILNVPVQPSMRSRAITRRDKSASAGLRECRNVLRISLLAMQSTLENLDHRSVEVRNEVAALARAQVLQQLAVLEGLVDTNSRSREEWLEAQNELDYRMHAYLVLTYDTRDCELLSIATRIEMVLRRQTLDETFLIVERYRLFRTQREVSEAMYLAARERLRLLHDRAHAAVCVFSRAGPRYVTALARAEDLRSTVTSLEREVKRELASLAVGLEEAFREHEGQFPGFEPPQQMEEGEVRRDLEEAAEEMEAEGDAL